MAPVVNAAPWGLVRFAQQPLFGVFIETEGRVQELQRDVAFELGVSREPHLSHAAGAELRLDFIVR